MSLWFVLDNPSCLFRPSHAPLPGIPRLLHDHPVDSSLQTRDCVLRAQQMRRIAFLVNRLSALVLNLRTHHESMPTCSSDTYSVFGDLSEPEERKVHAGGTWTIRG